MELSVVYEQKLQPESGLGALTEVGVRTPGEPQGELSDECARAMTLKAKAVLRWQDSCSGLSGRAFLFWDPQPWSIGAGRKVTTIPFRALAPTR